MEEKLIKIEVRTKTVEIKNGEHAGETFLAYKGLTKKGWTDLRFTKEVEKTPTETCNIYVKKENVNINQKSRYPVIWVRAIEKIEKIDFEQKTADYFDLD